MYRYTAKVRLGGSMLNEVKKASLTPAEIVVLRRLHGDDAVTEITPTAYDDTASDTSLRKTLDSRYGRALTKQRRGRSIDEVFGPVAALPKQLPGVDHSAIDAELKAQAKASTKASKAAAATAAASDDANPLDDLDGAAA